MHLMALSDFTLASGLLCLQLPGGCYVGSPVEEKQSSDQQFRFQSIRFVGEALTTMTTATTIWRELLPARPTRAS